MAADSADKSKRTGRLFRLKKTNWKVWIISRINGPIRQSDPKYATTSKLTVD
jgi:hypothetical protein